MHPLHVTNPQTISIVLICCEFVVVILLYWGTADSMPYCPLPGHHTTDNSPPAREERFQKLQQAPVPEAGLTGECKFMAGPSAMEAGVLTAAWGWGTPDPGGDGARVREQAPRVTRRPPPPQS